VPYRIVSQTVVVNIAAYRGGYVVAAGVDIGDLLHAPSLPQAHGDGG
jgi:hypothetical protein